MENLNFGRLGQLDDPNHLIQPDTITDSDRTADLPSDTVAHPVEKQCLGVHLNSTGRRCPVSAGIVVRDYLEHMNQPRSVQTKLGVLRRSEISKLRNKGVIVKVVGKVSTVLHDFRLQQETSVAYCRTIKPAMCQNSSSQINYSISYRYTSVFWNSVVFSAKDMGEENYVVQFIKSEQASIKHAEHDLAERKKRLNRFMKEHQSAINSDSSIG